MRWLQNFAPTVRSPAIASAGLLWLVLATACESRPRARQSVPDPTSVPVVDLRSLDFRDGQTHIIPTRWAMYWRKLLPPGTSAGHKPDAIIQGMRPWSRLLASPYPGNGFATYRTVLLLPPGQDYGFHIQQQLVAYRVFANGQLVVQAGRVGRSATEVVPERRNHVFAMRPQAERVELVVHVSNFHLFRGGLRGLLRVGALSGVNRWRARRQALEACLFGLFGAVFLYHLAFYFMRPGESSFLYFGLLCLTFAARMPFMGEKLASELQYHIPFSGTLTIMGILNVASPPLVCLFIRSLFPEVIGRRTVIAYAVASVLLIVPRLFGLRYLAPSMFLLYAFVFAPAFTHATIVVARQAFKGDRTAAIMTVGMGIISVFGLYAMYRNWMASEAAVPAYIGFVGFVLVQSFALGRIYRDSLVRQTLLTERLARSKEALSNQRKELEINLHDSLGGALTDLKILAERGQEQTEGGTPDTRGPWDRMVARLDDTNRMFRGQLLFMEDMELAARDPVTGLHMMILRRYTDARRELMFEVSDPAAGALAAAMDDDSRRLDILQLARELCTNDLKYGCEEGRWNFAIQGRILILTQANRLAPGMPSPEGRLIERARRRVDKLGGSMESHSSAEEFMVEIRLPG